MESNVKGPIELLYYHSNLSLGLNKRDKLGYDS